MLTLSYAYCKLNRWKQEELTHLGYKWRWSNDGLFIIFAAIITLQAAFSIPTVIVLTKNYEDGDQVMLQFCLYSI